MQLQKLILASNGITSIPDDVAALTALAVLDVHDVRLVFGSCLSLSPRRSRNYSYGCD